jgi:hypothetical protein
LDASDSSVDVGSFTVSATTKLEYSDLEDGPVVDDQELNGLLEGLEEFEIDTFTEKSIDLEALDDHPTALFREDALETCQAQNVDQSQNLHTLFATTNLPHDDEGGDDLSLPED